MRLESVKSALRLGEGDALAALAAGWEASQRAPGADDPIFLAQEYVVEAYREADLPAEVHGPLLDVAARTRADPALRALAWHCHYTLLRAEPFDRAAVAGWPFLDAASFPGGDLLYVLVALSGLPEMRAFYDERAIPEAVFRATVSDVGRWMEDYRQRHGRWGLRPSILSWLRHHLNGEIFQLGRLQFEPGTSQSRARFYRHSASGAVLALSEAGVRYRADGQIDGAGGVFDTDGGWEATLEVTEETVGGYPLLPEGRAVRERVRLPRAEWRPVLGPGDPVLHIHMPAGSPMAFEACGESFRRALAFFPRYLPDRPFVAFDCSSWLLDAQLATLLPPESNIARFQGEVYLLPSPGGGRSTLERVFGAGEVDLARAPRDTALRRALLDHLRGGGHLRGGRCVLFPTDLDWGSQVYRRRSGAAAAGLTTLRNV